MNFRTTMFLSILTLAGVLGWLGLGVFKSGEKAHTSLDVLKSDLAPENITRLQVFVGKRELDLKRSGKDEWSLPGNWPARKQEVAQLVNLVGHLESRFAPLPLRGDTAEYGLDEPRVKIVVTAGEKQHDLFFGEAPVGEDDRNRFSRPTYMRLDDREEVVRLAPGILASLDRSPDYYQQRRLFRIDRVAEGSASLKVERLNARTLAVQGADGAYELVRKGEGDQTTWNLSQPMQDRADPEKIKTLLTSAPDIWVEQFVENPKEDLAVYGLKKPDRTLAVTSNQGETLTLLIGSKSGTKTRTIVKPPPPSPPGFPPMPPVPTTQIIHEEYLYAKLKDNAQIFEVKADKLKDLFIAGATLRDPRLARFNTNDANRLEIVHGKSEIVFEKVDQRWKLTKPLQSDAEAGKVDELLDKLSGLEAKDKDVIDQGDLKALGFEPPTSIIKVTVEESKRQGAAKKKTTKTYTFRLGKSDKAKLFVRVDDWQRINSVDDSLAKLVERPALAYRGRRVFDFSDSDLAKIECTKGNAKFTLEQEKGIWKLAEPVRTDADSAKSGKLVADLVRLEAIEYVGSAAKPEDLDKIYGLAKPELHAKLTFTKADKPPKNLLLGKQRGEKPEYFAKLEDADAVFVVKKELHDLLEMDSLAYLPSHLWQFSPAEATEVKLDQDGKQTQLKRVDNNWRITQPFEAAVLPSASQPLIGDLAHLRAERFVAHSSKELALYGLDKPAVRLAVTAVSKTIPTKDKPDAKDETKEYVVLIGKPTTTGGPGHFAKLGNGEAIFVLADKLVASLSRGPLEMLDRRLLTLDPASITAIKRTNAEDKFTLERSEKGWKVITPAAQFAADKESLSSQLAAWSNLSADRFVAYGPKVDLALYGLDKPMETITVTLKKKPGKDEKEPAKAEEHVLTLGKSVEKDPGSRYARLDNGPGVVVLAPHEATALTQDYLHFVDHTVFDLDAANIRGLVRKKGVEELELVKKDDGWQMVKPEALRADGPNVEKLLGQLAHLRAVRVVAYQPKDLKAFGLDAPEAIVTLSEGEGKPFHTLKIGKKVDEKRKGEHYATTEGSVTIFVIPGPLARLLLGSPLQFHDHLLPRFADADSAVLERGPRKVTFAKVDGTWKTTVPVKADAEQIDLDEFLNSVASLRASELIADKAKDKTYGLDQPAARWNFRLGDKDVLGLLVGNLEKSDPDDKEKHEPRRYARLTNGTLVFLLDAKMTRQVMAEYRSRTLWPTFDAAQVVGLRFERASNSFALSKTGNIWTVEGKLDALVRAQAVSETLDALARLSTQRFVADKDADFTLFGLKPPKLTIEVLLPTGARKLEVGRQEGNSKEYYARVVEGDRTDVFILSEAEAAKIVRDLAAFKEPAPKSKPVEKP